MTSHAYCCSHYVTYKSVEAVLNLWYFYKEHIDSRDLINCTVIAKFHYTDPTRTKSAHIVGEELNSTTRTRHGPDRTRTDFFAAKLRWVRAGPVGPVSWNLARTRQRARTLSVSGPCRVRVVEFSHKRTRLLRHFSRFAILLHRHSSKMAKLFHI